MLFISLIQAVGIPFSCFELENVLFSSQEFNLKQHSPAGSGKKNKKMRTQFENRKVIL